MSHSPQQAQAAHPCSGHTRTPAGTDRQQPGEWGPRLTAGGAGFAQKVPVTQVCQHSHAPFQVFEELPPSPHGTFCCPQQRFKCMIPLHPPERLVWPRVIAKTLATSTLAHHEQLSCKIGCNSQTLNSHGIACPQPTLPPAVPVLQEGSALCCCLQAGRGGEDQILRPQKPPSTALEKGLSCSGRALLSAAVPRLVVVDGTRCSCHKSHLQQCLRRDRAGAAARGAWGHTPAPEGSCINPAKALPALGCRRV